MVTRVIPNYGYSETVDAPWVHTDGQVIKSKNLQSPTAGQCMAGERAQPSGYNCPRTEAMRTAVVQGGGEDTLSQEASDILSTCMSCHEEKFERIAYIYINIYICKKKGKIFRNEIVTQTPYWSQIKIKWEGQRNKKFEQKHHLFTEKQAGKAVRPLRNGLRDRILFSELAFSIRIHDVQTLLPITWVLLSVARPGWVPCSTPLAAEQKACHQSPSPTKI